MIFNLVSSFLLLLLFALFALDALSACETVNSPVVSELSERLSDIMKQKARASWLAC